MNPAQALLREVLRASLNDATHLDPDLRDAIREELERAATAPEIPTQTHHTDPPPYFCGRPSCGICRAANAQGV
jgi:hypothetical protein